MSEALLKLRERLRSRKPKFLRQESWRYKRLETGWRKPKGKTSKMRRRLRGWPKLVKVGYKIPKEVRGLHPSGSIEALVRRPEDLKGLDPERHVVRIAHTVGERKRVAIIEKCAELGLRVLNPGIALEAPKVEGGAAEG